MDTKRLRHVLGSFATGVCVITMPDPDHVAGHVLGMTANSFTSVSLDPPLILWCLDLKAHRCGVFTGAGRFGVNVLSAGQETLSRRFARENAHIVADEGLLSDDHPLKLRNVAAFLDCEHFATYEAGDHRIIVGRVTQFERDDSLGGLTFYGGRYGEIGPLKQDKIA
ncbi:MAG TPA: flavin reductase family protein [Asticcacaulis sp.]|nr:flavin reductase family protein [Asticcacaulis sp.]